MSALKKWPFLHRLFNKTATPPPHTVLPDRAERVDVVALHNARFWLNLPQGKKDFQLKNLSTTGMALILKDSETLDLPAPPITGVLDLADKSHIVSIEIRHRSPMVLGCQFQYTDFFFQRSIRDHLFGELLGLGLKQINPEILYREEGQESFWFADVRQNGLHFVLSQGKLAHAEIHFLGHTLMVDRGGHIRQNDSSNIDPVEIREMAIKLIKSIKGLQPVHCERLCQILSSPIPPL